MPPEEKEVQVLRLLLQCWDREKSLEEVVNLETASEVGKSGRAR
jgi:hypothetical protein